MLPKEKIRKNRFKLKGRVIFFATNNIHKFNEVRNILAKQGVSVGMLRVKSVEIQSDSLTEIARVSAKDAFKRCKLPIIVEDAGLFVDALNGFPGPYTAYVYKTVGNKGLLKLMEQLKSRTAKFRSSIAYCDNVKSEPLCFEGESLGEVIGEERANSPSSFGFDPIFQPCGSNKTFAEMNIEEKNLFSHRAQAIIKFASWYISHR
ncbi:MAG: XTP/dITP diphosphatase [Candidatus Bathyarchaeota archaeon]|nr:XTP/dITP diphosphatase [Candidatus Bathyarchaeota archaeon]